MLLPRPGNTELKPYDLTLSAVKCATGSQRCHHDAHWPVRGGLHLWPQFFQVFGERSSRAEQCNEGSGFPALLCVAHTMLLIQAIVFEQ